ncbi:immunoglobulin-like domain-containing protein [Paenibacillus sepulcri]|uniref:immunoglobulin-like domain-containing protein n=1 Tax=Paenibacillus sepulcri TaxID=359917 RepID=UPI0036229B1A
MTALTLEEGNLNPPFQTAVAQYTYSYIGASVDKVHVAAAVNMPSQASLYINNQLQASGSATAVEVSGPSTVIPIRMEPLLLPGKTYTITVIRDSVYPVVQYGENGSLSSAKTAATLVTAADAESGLDPASLQYVWTQSPDVPASGWTSFASGDTLIRNSGDGKWYLHIQAKDLAGNRTDEVSDPFVLDNTPPVLALNGSNPMNVPVGHPYIEPGAIAEDRIDGIIPATAIAKSGRVDTASIGNYQILYEVSDHAGNQASVTRNVNVYDGDAPAVYLKGPNPMEAEAFSTFTDPGAAAVDPQDGALEPIVTGTVNTRQLGTYTLLYSAVDQANNAAPTVTRYVYVKDTAAPVITLEGDSVMVAGVGSTYQDPGARAEDLYEGDLSALISIQGTVDSSRPGTYSLNYNVIDTSNNEALSVRRLVYVIPPPVITLLGQSVIKLKAGETFTEPGAQAADAYYGDISDRITVTGSVNTQAAGTYMLRYNVQDPAGITAAEAIRTVTVENQVYYNYPPSIASGNAALKDISFVVEGKQLLSSPDGMIETTAEQIEIHALPADSGSTISLQGEALTGPITIQLSEGDNVIVISVKAPDGTVQSYTYTIHRTVYKGTNEASCAFTDIHGHWAAVQICEAASAGIVQGDPDLRFHADDAVTRAEFVVMLYRILDDSSSETTAESTAAVFTDSGDIPDWARQAIHYGVSQGIVKGYTDGAFLPNHTISRNELAVLAARTLQLQIDISSRTSFRDDSDIPIWAKPYVLASVRQGLLQGRSSNLFMPTDKTTRAEAVTLLLRMQKVLSALSAAPS